MRSNIKYSSSILLATFFLLPFATFATGDPLAVDDWFWVDPTISPSLFITFAQLEQNDLNSNSQITITAQPLHGTLTMGVDSLVYTPKDSFWSLGTDHFSYTLAGTSTATVRLLRRFPQEPVREEKFDLSPNPPYSTSGTATLIEEKAEARIVGSGGLRVYSEAGSLVGSWADLGGDDSDDGGATLLGCGFTRFPVTANIAEPANEVAILMMGPAGFQAEDASLRVVLTRGVEHSSLRVDVRRQFHPGGFVSSASLPILREVAHLSIDWWDQGAILSADGLAVTVMGVPNLDLDFTDIRMGLMPLDPEQFPTADFDFDDFKLFRRKEAPESTLLKVDNFQSGDTASWSASYGNGLFTPTPPSGARVLETNLNLGVSFLADTTPEAEDTLGVRLRFDVSNLTMGTGDAFRLFDVGSDNDPLFGVSDFNVRLLGGANDRIFLVAFTTRGGALVSSNWYPVTGEHTVELQLRTSASQVANSGLARLWLDNVIVEEIENLDNDALLMEWVHLGALGVDPGTSGTLIQDDFESWRWSPKDLIE